MREVRYNPLWFILYAFIGSFLAHVVARWVLP